MNRPESIGSHLHELSRLAAEVGSALEDRADEVVQRILDTVRRGGRLLFCGNGGSAADAQHLAAEYVIRFRHQRRALPALALTTDSSVLTAGANDLGFEKVFARQVEALASSGDILFLHSTSGESENLVQAALAAKERGVATVAFLARGGGRLAPLVDLALIVPTQSTARAQEIHLALGHAICHQVEERLAGNPDMTEADPPGGTP